MQQITLQVALVRTNVDLAQEERSTRRAADDLQ